jgi:hypothetical protein
MGQGEGRLMESARLESMQYVTDSAGKRTAVLIGLEEWSALEADIYDVLVSRVRKNEPTILWETLKAESQSEVQKLERLYTFGERAEVLWFLEEYPVLVPLLLEAYDKIGNYFSYPQLSLEVLTDPETNGDRQLVVFIGTNLAPDEALPMLEQFDENWWLDASHKAQGNLCIHVEFR